MKTFDAVRSILGIPYEYGEHGGVLALIKIAHGSLRTDKYGDTWYWNEPTKAWRKQKTKKKVKPDSIAGLHLLQDNEEGDIRTIKGVPYVYKGGEWQQVRHGDAVTVGVNPATGAKIQHVYQDGRLMSAEAHAEVAARRAGYAAERQKRSERAAARAARGRSAAETATPRYSTGSSILDTDQPIPETSMRLAFPGETEGAKEGDMRMIGDRMYQLRGGRWHRVNEDVTTAEPANTLEEATVEDTNEPTESGDTSGLDGRIAGGDARDVDGTPDSAGAGGGTGEIITPKLVAARPDLTATADTSRIPERLRPHLAEHQQQGVALAAQAMDTQGGFLLADGTGAGKTRQLLAIAQMYADQGKKVLIIAPSGVIKQNWKKGTFAGSYAKDGAAMGVDVMLTRDAAELAAGQVKISTYDALSKLKNGVDGNTVILWDEAHAGKNADSARSKHMIEMSKNAHSVCYATATPADKPEHIPYLFRAGIFKGHKHEYIYEWLGLKSREINVPGGKTVRVWEVPRGKAAEVHHRFQGLFDDLTERGLMIQRGISMEGVNVEFNTVPVPPEAHQMLEDIARAYDNGENGGLEKAQMLMQQRRQLEPYKIPAAVEEVGKELAAGRQVVVFVSRVSESEVSVEGKEGAIASSQGTAGLLKQALLDAGIDDIVELHGAADTKAADAMAAFQSGQARVIVATIESGGTGVNLDDIAGDAPRTMLMLTPPFSAVENIQAAGRVWRMTTKSYPTLRYLFTDTPVDEWNREIIANKMAALGAAVPGIETLDLPSDISDAGLEAFLEAKREGRTPQGSAPRPPAPAPGVPRGFKVNRYAGYAPDGTYVPVGAGYIRQENGRWVTYAAQHISPSGEVLLKIEKPKTISISERLTQANTAVSKIRGGTTAVDPKVWQGGDRIRVYLNKPGSRDGYGYLEITADGKIRNQSSLGDDHPAIQSIASDLKKATMTWEQYAKSVEEQPCWDGYEMVGTKKKRGKRVPNCVPMQKTAKCPAALIEWRGALYRFDKAGGRDVLVKVTRPAHRF